MAEILLSRVGAGWEVRIIRPGLLARLGAWWRAQRQTRTLEALDPHTLKDIGLEALAWRVVERRRLETLQLQLAQRLG